MKKFLFLFAVVAAAAFAVSCEKEGEHQDGPQTVENVFEGAVPTGYFGYAEVSVPAGTETVYIEYTYKDGSTKTIAHAVTPEVAKPEGGRFKGNKPPKPSKPRIKPKFTWLKHLQSSISK